MSEQQVQEVKVEDFCPKCSAGKYVENKCTSYVPAGQENWILRMGWCPLGNAGPKPPANWKDPNEKKRVGQQKQKKR